MTRPTLPGKTIPLLDTGWLGREAPTSTGDEPEPIDRLRENGVAYYPIRVIATEPEEE